MPTLRQIADGRTITAYGTSEGVSKAWDTRGRGRNAEPDDREECVGPNCGGQEVKLPDKKSVGPFPVQVPHLDHLEFQMTSGRPNYNIHFDKEAMKSMLRMALVQLDQEDSHIQYLNTPGKVSTDHYATIKFRPKSTVGNKTVIGAKE